MSYYKLIFTVAVIFFISSCSVTKNPKIITSKQEAIDEGVYDATALKLAKQQRETALKKQKQLVLKQQKTQKQKTKATSQITFDLKRDSIVTAAENTVLTKKQKQLEIKSTLVTSANEYLGTPYQYGGTSKNGIDCSGFICQIYNSIELELPRTSYAQSKLGNKIKKKKAKTGDLIFFKTNRQKTISHVGMVINNFDGKIIFIHASTSNGVTISSLDETYYTEKYAKIKRILN